MADQKNLRYKVVFTADGEQRDLKFNGYDEKAKAKLFKDEYIQKGYQNVRIKTYIN